MFLHESYMLIEVPHSYLLINVTPRALSIQPFKSPVKIFGISNGEMECVQLLSRIPGHML